jgi:ribosomal protein L40E
MSAARFGNEQTRLRKEAGHPKLTEEAAARRRNWVTNPQRYRTGSAWVCPVCGTENGAAVERCRRCGRASLPPESMVANDRYPADLTLGRDLGLGSLVFGLLVALVIVLAMVDWGDLLSFLLVFVVIPAVALFLVVRLVLSLFRERRRP